VPIGHVVDWYGEEAFGGVAMSGDQTCSDCVFAFAYPELFLYGRCIDGGFPAATHPLDAREDVTVWHHADDCLE